MRRNPILAVIALVAISFTGCKNGGITNGLPIPADAVMVVHVNTASLTSKLSWKEIQQSGWYKQVFEKEQDSVYKAILQNPDASGVDLSSDFVAFTRKKGNGGYVVFEGKLKDANAFAAFAQKINAAEKPGKSGDLNTLKLSDKAQLVWNKETFMTISDFPAMHQAGMFGMQGNEDMQRTISQDSLTGFTKELFSLDADKSLEKDKRFKDLANDKGDIHMWIGSSSLSDMAGGMMAMMKLNNLLEGNVSTYTLNFDQGKIDVSGKTYLNKALTDIMKKYPSKNLDAETLKRIPSDNVVGAYAFNMNPDALREILRLGGLDGMANGALGQFNYSLDELLSATNGNFLFSLSDLSFTSTPDVTHMNSNGENVKEDFSMKGLFALSVKNKASFDKLLGLIRERMGPAMNTIKFANNNEWVAISNDSTYAQAYLAGGKHNVAFADKLSGHSFGFYVDIQKAMAAVGTRHMNNAYDSTVFALNRDMWQDAIATGGDMNDGVISFTASLNLVNKNENALKQLNQYSDRMAAADKLRPRPQYDMNDAIKDSIEVVTPVQQP